MIAVLHTRHNSAAVSPLHDPADRIALLAFFPLVVGLDTQNCRGLVFLRQRERL